MARKHVFPVCSQSSFVFDELPPIAPMVLSNLVDNSPSFISKTYHNGDGVVYRVFEDQQELVGVDVIIPKGSNRSEILVKLDQTKLDDFLSNESLTEWLDGNGVAGIPFRSGMYGVLYSMNIIHSEYYNNVPVENNLRPGHVICLASSTPTGVFRNENQEPLVELPQNWARWEGYQAHVDGNTNSVIEGVFESATNGSYLEFSVQGARVDIKQNKWATFMWTGTRWVLLGSNNWY